MVVIVYYLRQKSSRSVGHKSVVRHHKMTDIYHHRLLFKVEHCTHSGQINRVGVIVLPLTWLLLEPLISLVLLVEIWDILSLLLSLFGNKETVLRYGSWLFLFCELPDWTETDDRDFVWWFLFASDFRPRTRFPLTDESFTRVDLTFVSSLFCRCSRLTPRDTFSDLPLSIMKSLLVFDILKFWNFGVWDGFLWHETDLVLSFISHRGRCGMVWERCMCNVNLVITIIIIFVLYGNIALVLKREGEGGIGIYVSAKWGGLDGLPCS